MKTNQSARLLAASAEALRPTAMGTETVFDWGESISDMHFALGKKPITLTENCGGHWNTASRMFENLQIDSAVRKFDGPGIQDTAQATAINADWLETERLLDGAFKRHSTGLRVHQKEQLAINQAAYRAECDAIIGRADHE